MPDAKIIENNNTVKYVNSAQSGAKAVNMPTAVSNNAQHGSRIVGGQQGPTQNNGQTRVAVIATPPMQPRVAAPPRPGVAPRPNMRAGNGSNTRAQVIPSPMTGPALTPLTVEQGMFLMHLVDGFLLAQSQNGGPAADIKEIAEATMASLNAWTGALSTGVAETTPVQATQTGSATPAAPAVG